jgi:endonuclease-3
MTGGSYALLYDVPGRIEVSVGALGCHRLPAGGYVYAGSALSSGGFSRIDRHQRVAAGDHDTRHWHVDYLGGHDAVALVDDWRLHGRDAECALAARLTERSQANGSSGPPVPGFGSSDCDCPAHLVRFDSVDAARRAIRETVAEVADDE